MNETSLQVVAAIKQKDFWKTARWVSYTNKYNDRLIAYMGPGTGPWNIPVVNLTPGDQLAEDTRLVEWEKTQPFFEEFMKRVCLCLNYCKDKDNEELKEAIDAWNRRAGEE